MGDGEGDADVAIEKSQFLAAPKARVLCFCGSMSDRFPIKSQNGRPTVFDDPCYHYFGQLVGANLLSKRGPIEAILPLTLLEESRRSFALPFFKRAFDIVGLSTELNVTLLRGKRVTRDRRNERGQWILRELQSIADGKAAKDPVGIHISQRSAQFILDTTAYDDFMDLEEFLRGSPKPIKLRITEGGADTDRDTTGLSPGIIRLAVLTEMLKVTNVDVRREESRQLISIFELSSGEFHMLTTILGLGFSLQDNCVVLVDEPEGGLHPLWQSELMSELWRLVASYKDCHLIVSTHSPLIVASAPDGSAVVDMELSDIRGPDESSYGQSADQILFDQFGVSSSRNLAVVDVVQRAIDLIERNQERSGDFAVSMGQILSVRERLHSGDPLVDVIDAILSRLNDGD
jgi:hypothetical protein